MFSLVAETAGVAVNETSKGKLKNVGLVALPGRPCAPGSLACHRFLQNRSGQCLAHNPNQTCVTKDQQQGTGRCYDLLPLRCAFTGAEHTSDTSDHYLHHNRYTHRGDNDGRRWHDIRRTPVPGLQHLCCCACRPLSGHAGSYKSKAVSFRMTVSTVSCFIFFFYQLFGVR